MPLETGTYISDLNILWPTGDDPKSQGDDHFRLTKTLIKNTFPLIVGAISASDVELSFVKGLTSAVQPQINAKFDKVGGTLSGSLTLTPVASAAQVFLNKSAGAFNNALTGQAAGLSRWLLELGNAAAESGSNVGSDLTLSRYTDAGALIDVPLTVTRSTGAVTIPNALAVGGALAVSGAASVGGALTVAGAASVQTPTLPVHAVNKAYADNLFNAFAAAVRLPRQARTSNVALGVGDVAQFIDITSGTFAQTFNASSTLGAAWWVWVSNSGSGVITLTPNAGDLIDGLASRPLAPGDRRLIQCDGTTLRTVIASTANSLVLDSRTANTALVVTDRAKWIDCTGTFVQSFAASATLFSGWWCWVSNSGSGPITLTPNASELIDGLTSRILWPGERRLIQCDGAALRTVAAAATIMSRRPIFSAPAAAMYPSTTNEPCINNTYTAFASSGVAGVMLASNGTNFVCTGYGSLSTCTSSPDGKVWTIRTLPASATWIPASDGVGFMAVGAAGAQAAYSATGTSWVGTSLPPAGIKSFAGLSSGRYAGVPQGGASSLYLTTNSGASWTTEAFPVSAAFVYASAGLFVAFASAGTAYYTSATGAAGSWAARATPGATTVANMRLDFDGSMIANDTAGLMWRSTDAINWTQIAGTLPTPVNNFLSINGDVMSGVGSTANGFVTIHNGKSAIRTFSSASTATTTIGNSYPGLPVQARLGNVNLLATLTGANVMLFDATATDAQSAMFDAP